MDDMGWRGEPQTGEGYLRLSKAYDAAREADETRHPAATRDGWLWRYEFKMVGMRWLWRPRYEVKEET